MADNFIANPYTPAISSANPLQLAGQVMGLKQQQIATEDAQRTLAANKAVSQIVQQSTNPDGSIDYSKMHQLLAADPNAAYNLQAATQAAQSSQGTDIENQGRQLALTQGRLEQLGQRLISLYQKKDVSPEDVRESIGQAVKDGVLHSDRAMDVLSSVPNDPSKLHAWLGNHARELYSAQQQLQMNTPEYTPIDVGNGTILYQRNPQAAEGQGVSMVAPRNLSPSELADQVQVTGPDGRPYFVSRAALLQQEGVNSQGQQVSGAAADLALPGYDRGAAPGAPGIPGAVQAGPSQQEQQSWTAATTRQQEREKAALDVPNQIGALDQASAQLSKLSDTSWAAGPKSHEIANLIGALNTAGLHIDASQVNSRASLAKYLENAVNNSAADAGFNGSNERLQAWKAGQPDPDKLPTSALKSAVAYIRAQTIGHALLSQYVSNFAQQNGPNSVARAEQNWSKHYDANALYLATLTPSSRAKAMASMGKAEAKRATDNLSAMLKEGLINPQDLARYGQAQSGD